MNKKKMTQRKQQAMQTKETLLNTALDLIAEQGYDQVSIQDLCQAVGVSTGAFYHHFTGKEDIIVESYRRYDEHFEAHASAQLESLPPLDKIIEAIKYQVKYAEDMGVETMQQFYRSQLQAGRAFFISTTRKFPLILTQMITDAQQAGVLSDTLTATQITRHLLRFSRGMIYDWCAYNGSYDIVEETSQSLSLFLTAFLIKHPKAPHKNTLKNHSPRSS
ncbi:TetR/AcrR family transcriptional regulator [Anoxynatronum buryatiense]|uniref:Transcriptional regulator, TetR family n=1 Tax=Anoxynatronum buryatiense TaxID=489973 RepID=A0AA45WVI5_9CLOT|nr:TetR/AcrR family transcriptional regulator [Anoxynatronum buryatiense]SMP53730.1 transcriptional regulator, TetR family [Anoxynatronum buryatiense]